MRQRLKLMPYLFTASAAFALAAAAPAAAQAPANTTDGEWLTLSGSVVSSDADSFLLDYGAKTITVEMDDYDWYADNPVLKGDRVTVTGRMDADFWEQRKIEASSVFVKSLNTMFHASAADEEGGMSPVIMVDPLTNGESVSLTGRVTAISGDELTLDAGMLDYTVDVGELGYNPLDNAGPQRIAVGDRISVFGRMDDADLFDNREIDAKSISELG
jgi:uncharacterized protein YdeI (BOF family)